MPPAPDPIPALCDAAKTAFARAFGNAAGAGVIRSPGRLDLLGGHTEFNDGFVLPIGTPGSMVVAFRPGGNGRSAAHPTGGSSAGIHAAGSGPAPTGDSAPQSSSGTGAPHPGNGGPTSNGAGRPRIRVFSAAFAESADIELNGRPVAGRPAWADHVRGIVASLQDRGVELRPTDLAIAGDLPSGLGMGSGAALQVAVATALLQVAGKELPRVDLARACREADLFAGGAGGPTGPFAALMARRDHALLVDSHTLEHQHILVDAEEADLLVADTGVRFDARRPEFEQRRRECRDAVRLLAKYDPAIASLRHVAPELVEDHFHQLPREAAIRARHVVNENLRVLHAAGHLKAGRMAHFGRLLTESHASLRDNFDLTFREADLLVRTAAAMPGVFGARLAGAGLGGPVIVLVAHGSAATVRAGLETEFFREFGRRLTMHNVRPAAGAAVLEECRSG